jgi:hypothetical protein
VIVRPSDRPPQRSRPAATAARPARRCCAVLVVAAALSATVAIAGESGPPDSGATLAYNTTQSRLELTGLPASTLSRLRSETPEPSAWARILAIYVDDDATLPPLLGAYGIDGDRIVFAPRFPLRPGLAYRGVFDPAALADGAATGLAKLRIAIELPAPPPAAVTRVAGVYPSGDVLPANLLKFYIHFTAPMSRGEAYRRLHILDADGREVPDAFLRLGEELWTRDGRRFTLLFDPARIKRGLVPHLEEGAPLMPGRSYTLVVDAAWRDARGRDLAAEVRKPFRTGEPDESQPDPTHWNIVSPAAGTREPLAVEFDEPLDHALAERLIVARDSVGREVEGRVRVTDHETRWELRPAVPWLPGRYVLDVAGALEDRAGNSVGRPFEVANAGDEVGVTSAAQVEIAFNVAAP